MIRLRYISLGALLVSALLALLATPVRADENAEWSKAGTVLGEARMLRFRQPIVRRTYTAEQAARLRLSQFQKVVLNDKLDARERFLQTLGLWPKDCNLRSTLEALAPDFSIDWYDPARHEVVVVKGAESLRITDMLGLGSRYNLLLSALGIDVDSLYRTYLLEHCLQDQYFGLSALFQKTDGSMDKMVALAALCEGDALLSTITAMSESLYINPASVVRTASSISPRDIYARLAERFPALNQVPPLFRDYAGVVLFDGLKFASTVKNRAGWGALNRVFREGPVSSKQILHPMQYLQGEEMAVDLVVDAPEQVEELKQTGSDSAGEFLISCWAQHRLGEKAGKSVGCGWRGDRWIVYEGKRQAEPVSALVWATAWECAVDAQEFAEAVKASGASIVVDKENSTVLAVWASETNEVEELLNTKISLSDKRGATESI